MSFVSNALGISNGYSAASAAGSNGQITYDPNLVANAQAANTNYGNVNTAQTNLANQLQAQANGQGPNLAALQLQQATNQNNQQAAGAMASQRGMNPALAQRIISQNQASNNQNAAGQSGVLRAQQQLAAESGLGNVLGQQGTEANANAAANYSALGNQNNAVTGAVNSANQTNAQIAQNNSNQSAGIAGGIMNSIGSMFSEGGEVDRPEKHLERLLMSIGDKVKPVKLSGGGSPMSSIGSSLSGAPMNAIDPGLAQGPSAASDNLFGSLLGGGGGGDPASGATSAAPSASGGSVGGSAAGGASMAGGPMDAISGLMGSGGGGMGSMAMLAAAKGAEIPHFDGGGGIMSMLPMLAMLAAKGGKVPNYDQGGGIMSMLPMLAMLASKGGKVPAMVSPGERFIPPEKVDAVSSGKESVKTAGKKIPGKAKVKGDSEKNDTVKAKLAPGGVVIPRTKADNDEDAREFLHAIKAEKEKKNGPSGYAKILAAKRKNA